MSPTLPQPAPLQVQTLEAGKVPGPCRGALGGGRSQLCSRGSPLQLETRWECGRGGVNPGGAGPRLLTQTRGVVV